MTLGASLILSMSSRPSGRVRYYNTNPPCADEVAIVREPLHLSPYVIAVNEQGSHRSHDIATQIIVRVAKMLRKAGGLDRARTQASPVSVTRVTRSFVIQESKRVPTRLLQILDQAKSMLHDSKIMRRKARRVTQRMDAPARYDVNLMRFSFFRVNR